MTVKDASVILQMDQCLNLVAIAPIYSTLDTISGYWPIKIDYQDKDSTTFTSYHLVCRLLRMPCGLNITLSTLQHAVNNTSSTVKWLFALVYLDDGVNLCRYVKEHLSHPQTAQRLPSRAETSLMLNKCSTSSQTVLTIWIIYYSSSHFVYQRNLQVQLAYYNLLLT